MKLPISLVAAREVSDLPTRSLWHEVRVVGLWYVIPRGISCSHSLPFLQQASLLNRYISDFPKWISFVGIILISYCIFRPIWSLVFMSTVLLHDDFSIIKYAPIAKWIIYGDAVILFVIGCLSLYDPPSTFVIFIHSPTTPADSVSNPSQIYFTAKHSFVPAYGVGTLSLKNRYNDSSSSGLF